MNRSVTLPLKLRDVVEAAETRLRTTSGIPHDKFWCQVDAEYDNMRPTNNQDNSGENDLYTREYEH